MGFQKFTRKFDWLSFYYVKDLIIWKRIPNGFETLVDLRRVEPKYQDHIRRRVDEDGKSYLIQLATMSSVLSNGPKILKLKNLEFEIFENIDVNINVEDYNQPFPATVIDIPEKYAETKLVVDAEDNEIRRPISVIVNHYKSVGMICVSALFSNDISYSMLLDDRATIEEQIQTNLSNLFRKSLPMNADECNACRSIMKACLNACLYAEDFGDRLLGPANASLHQRQLRYVKLAEKGENSERLAKARRELKAHPFYYELKQEVKLRVAKPSHGEYNTTGSTVKPHWRKGHYRMHRYGPGLSLRKRIRIEAVFVNAEMFTGEMANTQTIIKD